MPDDERKLNDLRTDASGCKVVYIRAANADGLDADQDVGVPDDYRVRDISDLTMSDTGQNGGFHKDTMKMSNSDYYTT